MKKIFGKENRRGFENKTHIVKIVSCVCVLLIFSVVGMCFFFRPDYSETEKRNLTEYPSLTFEDFWSGKYFSDVSLWYSDTYPLRESMISANSWIKSLYGKSDDELIVFGNDSVQNAGDVSSFEGIWIQKNTATAFETYTFDQGRTDRYIEAINRAGKNLAGKANVYDMVIPLHYTYKLTDDQINEIGASDCKESINYIYSHLSGNVKAVDAHSQLWAHKNEYLYFRTDHHWTARGAYYAYVAFCNAKGITPTPLSQYERLTFDGFLGTFYSWSGQNNVLRDNPDFVEAFLPKGSNLATVTKEDGTKTEYAVVYKGADKYSAANKYLCFIGGDNPLTEIHNPNKNDGSSIVVIKESYGNAFVPFLVDSYEYVYVIDYRYYDGNLTDFVVENDVDDVLFLNTVVTTVSDRALTIGDLVG
ncbi:MAG: hypothetical protein E7667_03740 [Ruminococcaceae bacterium]|nr:hypothetical protein [Oscillospiraceae bacterium]